MLGFLTASISDSRRQSAHSPSTNSRNERFALTCLSLRGSITASSCSGICATPFCLTVQTSSSSRARYDPWTSSSRRSSSLQSFELNGECCCRRVARPCSLRCRWRRRGVVEKEGEAPGLGTGVHTALAKFSLSFLPLTLRVDLEDPLLTASLSNQSLLALLLKGARFSQTPLDNLDLGDLESLTSAQLVLIASDSTLMQIRSPRWRRRRS